MTRRELPLASVRRRYVGLTALRWLPLGLSAPVTVLLASARGLSPAQIGAVFAMHSVVTVLLELPTGGLADAIGHRPVLVLAAGIGACGVLTIAAAHDVGTFAVGMAVIGAGRALDSGPLESWFVDAAHAADPDADVTPGLSQAAAANGAGLAIGAVIGGLAPLLAGAGGGVLALPFLLAAAVDVVYLVAVVVLVVPLPGVRSTGSRTGVRGVPDLLRDTGRLVRGDSVLRLLLSVGVLIGIVLSALELLGPLHFAHLAGGNTRGSAVFGIVMAASFGASALGSTLAGRLRRAARGSTAAATAGLAVLGAVAVGFTGLAEAVLPAAVGFACFYLTNAAGWPLRQHLMHSRVESAHRSTTVSVASFALQIGGVTGSLLLPRLAEVTSIPVGFAVAAAALLVVALVSLRLPATSAAPAREPAVA